MRVVNKIRFYGKMIRHMIGGDTIGYEDYKQAYNTVAPTYEMWLDQMGQYTDQLIKPEYFPDKRPLKVLDLACGTGYITKQLLQLEDREIEITAVDLSDKMLGQLENQLNHQVRSEDKFKCSSRVKTINSDGIEFLETTTESYDVIFCGWALPYFDHDVLLKLCSKRLYKDGIMAVISNSQGTLEGVEKVFLEVMKKHQETIHKPMDIRFKLPKDQKMLSKWFEKYGFELLSSATDEVAFSFEQPKDLYDWVMNTGALAGTKEIFVDYALVEDAVIAGLAKEKYNKGLYWMNHKFVYGIYRLKA